MRRRFCFSLFLFLCVAAAPAQDGDAVADTVAVPVQLSAEEGSSRAVFDSIGPALPADVRSIPQPVIDSLQRADDFWYANSAKRKKAVPTPATNQVNRSFFQQRWFRNLLWAVILASFCGVVLWYLISSNILLFRKRARLVESPAETDENNEDIFSRNFEKEIEAAADGGNFRLAVRLHYLHTLKELSDRRLIDYRHGRTNRDYVAQLKDLALYKAFFRLTRNFEYIWYGQFPLSAEAYELLQADFANFKNSLPV